MDSAGARTASKRSQHTEPQVRRAGDENMIVFVNFRKQEPSRTRRKEELTHGNAIKALTVNLVTTYTDCSSEFRYTAATAPRRVLTKLSKGVHNQGYDNANHDYICRVGDKIVNPDGQTYELLERLGQGTFGQVLKCGLKEGGAVALKIIKNKPAYFHQALLEVHILQTLNSKYDPEDQKRIVRMVDFFVYRKHLCIAFELLSVNMYDVLKQNSFRGVSMTLIRVLTDQILKAMKCLREAHVIHCDLKPENVLLSNMQHTHIKLIDFGSACFENHTVYPYIQSRFYRSPEVLLGLPYTGAIDMWSLGCICAELFLGLPIFPGHSEYDQVCRIVEVLGVPPISMLEAGKHRSKFFKRMEQEIPAPPDTGDGDLASASGDDGTECSADTSAQGLQHIEAMGPEDDSIADDPRRSAGTGETSDGQEDRCAPAATGTSGSGASTGANRTATDDADESAANFMAGVPVAEAVSAAPAESAPSEDAPADAAPAEAKEPETPAAEDVPTRSESFLEVLKRKFMASDPPASQAAPPGPVLESTRSNTADTAGGSSSGACVAAGGAPSDSGPSAPGSAALSTGTPLDAAAEANTRDSSDGRGATSSDGGPRGSQQGLGRTPRTGRRGGRRTRTPRTKRNVWRLKTREEYERDDESHKKQPIPKKYCNFKSLEQMVELVPFRLGPRKAMTEEQETRIIMEEKERRACFLQFLTGVLNINAEERWTPNQADRHSFISGEKYDPNWAPPPDEPYKALYRDDLQRRGQRAPQPGADQVPRLPTEAMGHLPAGGSARTWQECNTSRHGGADGGTEHQPKSAPATSRCGMGSARGSLRTGMDGDQEKTQAKQPLPGVQGRKTPPSEPAVCGLWGQVCAGIPLPDDNPAESYRPNIEKISEDFLRGLAESPYSAGSSVRTLNAPQAYGADNYINSTRGGSTGASMYSSASSTGSTPVQGQAGGRGRRNLNGSPSTGIGSPLSAGHHYHRTRGMHHSFSQEHTKLTASRTTGTWGNTASSPHSPHGSAASTVMPIGTTSGTPLSAIHTPQSDAAHTTGAPATARTTGHSTGGSRDGSRGSSPWRLPSPTSEISSVSDRMNSSQPSGSDSCGEALPHDGGMTCRFEGEFSGEDASQSDTHFYSGRGFTQPSDSDGTMTPGSHDNVATHSAEEQRSTAVNKDPQTIVWKNIETELARVELSRDRLPRRLDITQSPGSAGATFREAVGMNESGPVIPFGHGARRDANSVAGPGGNPAGRPFSPQPRNTGSTEGSNHVGFTHPQSVLSGLGSSGGSAHGRHGRNRMRGGGV